MKTKFMLKNICYLLCLVTLISCSGVKLSPEEKLVGEIEQATAQGEWDANPWRVWSFAGRRHYVWDKSSGRIRLAFQGYDIIFQKDAILDGKVFFNDTLVEDSTKAEILNRAWGAFCNDSFWLNAPGKLKDPGVKLSRKDSAGIKRLLVEYTTGGVTPGDKYLWYVDKKGLPTKFEMWVSNITEPGFQSTWDGWTEVNGAKVSTIHEMEGFTLVIDSVNLGTSFQEVGWKDDPFQWL